MKKLLLLFLCLWASSVQAATYYVSASGEDSCRDGLSPATAFRSIARVNQLVLHPGDSVLFEGGSTFSGTIILAANDTGTIDTPVFLSSYGTGPATIASGMAAGLRATNVSGITVDSLNFVGSGSPVGTTGLQFVANTSDGEEGLLLNNIDVSGYGGFGVQVISSVATVDAYRHIRLTNSTIHNNIGSGVSISAATAYANTDVSISNVVAHDNTGYAGAITNAGSGIVVGGTTTVTIQGCETYANGALNDTSGIGPAGIVVYDSTGVLIQNNNSHGNLSAANDGDGYDIDQNTANAVIQNNVASGNQGAGYLLTQPLDTQLWSNNQFLSNSSVGDALNRLSAISLYGNIRNTGLNSNTVTLAAGASPTAAVQITNAGDASTHKYVDTVTFTNNTFATTGPDLVTVSTSQVSGKTALSFANNGYRGIPFVVNWGASVYNSCPDWHNATGQETCTNPDLTSLTPNSGGRGATVAPVITGVGFDTGPTCVFGAGITVNSCVYVSSTEIDANVTIAGGAAFGAYTVTVVNASGQSASLVGGFTVTGGTGPAPTVTSTTPNSGAQGATLTGVLIAGTGFQSNPTCSFGAGITVTSCVQNSAIQIAANLTIAGGATLGFRTVTVTNPDTQSGNATNAFTVTAFVAPAPTITSVTPATGAQGTTNTGEIIVGTGFQAGITCAFGSGITINSCTRNSATQLTVSITIDVAAALGVRTVMVTNTDAQSASKINGFTVQAPNLPGTGGIDPRTKTVDTDLIAGMTTYVLTDITGAPRPRGGVWDLGAYTYAPLPPPSPPGLATDCTLYAAPNGQAANSGLTPALPKPLNGTGGASAATVPGSVVCLMGGTYNLTDTFSPSHNGTASQWIVYKAYGDSTPTLLRTAAGTDTNMVHLFNAGTDPTLGSPRMYIEFNGLSLDGALLATSGFHAQASHHLRFLNNRIANMTSAGIAASKYNDYIVAIGNQITHCGYGTGTGSAITLNVEQYFDHLPGFHSYVVNNIISGSYDSTSHADGNGIIMDLSQNSGANIATADVPPVLIANNVVYENGGRCIELFSVANIWVVNNTCYKNTLDTVQVGLGEFVTNKAKNSFYINNISYSWKNTGNPYQEIGAPTGMGYYSDLYFNGVLNFTPSDPSQFLNRDPVFVSPPAVDPTAGGQYATAIVPWLLGTALQLHP